MTKVPPERVRSVLDEIYASESRRILATLIRLLGDFDLAEDALHDAFAIAMEQWPQTGIPANPRAWLISTGRFKAIDQIRRRTQHKEKVTELAEQIATTGGSFGPYTLQAAISATHASAPSPDQTDWGRIVELYDLLLRIHPSPVVELNRAVAVASAESTKRARPISEHWIWCSRRRNGGFYRKS